MTSLWKRIRNVLTGARQAEQLAQINRRLERLEAQGDTLHKIWLRTRHLEPAIQALLRARYFDPASLPYPERLIAQRFRLGSQNQEDGLTLALLHEAGTTTRRFIEIGSGLSGGNGGFLAREWGWNGLMVDGHRDHMAQVARRFPMTTSVAAWITRDNINALITEHGYAGEVDLFSLDLDGNDYWIWEAVTVSSPRVLILEYNSMFGPDRAVTIPYDPQFDRHRHHSMYYGASLQALTKLNARKGYRLVAVEPAGVNAFFLRHDVATHIPACDASRAYRLLEKYDVLMQKGEDVFEYAEKHQLPLVEIS